MAKREFNSVVNGIEFALRLFRDGILLGYRGKNFESFESAIMVIADTLKMIGESTAINSPEFSKGICIMGSEIGKMTDSNSISVMGDVIVVYKEKCNEMKTEPNMALILSMWEKFYIDYYYDVGSPEWEDTVKDFAYIFETEDVGAIEPSFKDVN